jgi:hypothetical protein
MVYSKLTYGILCWGGALLETQGYKRLINLHNKIIFNLFSNPGENRHQHLNDICKRNGILKLIDLYKYHSTMAMYKTLHTENIPFLFDNIADLLRNHNHDTRNRDNFLLPFPTVRSVKINYHYQAIKQWNNLPNYLKSSASLRQFNRDTKKYIINQL